MWHDTEDDFNQEFGYDDDASYEHEHYNGLHHEPAEADDEEKKKEDDDSKNRSPGHDGVATERMQASFWPTERPARMWVLWSEVEIEFF